jgi:C-terminal processing protease CtpA/Prc
MSHIRWSRKGAVLAALIGTTLLAAYPVWAQNQPTPKTNTKQKPDQVLNLLDVAGGKPIQALLEIDASINSDAQNLTDLILAARLHDPADEMLGATLQPVSDTLRAQLGISAGQGLLVVNLRDDGASAQAGLKQNDILLTLAGQPLAAADDLRKHLKAAGESAVPLKVLRAGKPLVVQVRPVYRVTLGPAAEHKTEYYIGVSIDAPDDAVRAQLALPAGQGVIISDVLQGSPAEKAGIKKHDIVLDMGGKLIDSPQTLASLVQAAQDRPTTLKVLRAGKPVAIPITGAVRKVEASSSSDAYYQVLALRQEAATLADKIDYVNLANRRVKLAARAGGDDLRQRLDQLEQELKAIRAAVDKVNETLQAIKATKRD